MIRIKLPFSIRTDGASKQYVLLFDIRTNVEWESCQCQRIINDPQKFSILTTMMSMMRRISLSANLQPSQEHVVHLYVSRLLARLAG